MKILFNIGHPGQVHLFKNLIWELERRGHQCKITTIAKDVSLYLLDAYGFKYEVVGEGKPTLATKALELIRVESSLYWIAHSFKPDLLVGGVGNVYVAHVGKLLRKPSVVFDDTEHAKIDHRLMDPFVSAICTPSCYRGDIGPKQIRYNGYHELAYLHPNYFRPNPAVLNDLGMSPDENIIVVRFVSWNASHDVGHHGVRDRIGLVKDLEKYGRVLITSEERLPEALKQYSIRVSPERLHDLLYYATLYVGEGATTASECAVLGTHAIYVNTLGLGYITEEEKKYHLITDFSSRPCTDGAVLAEARKLLENTNLRKDGKQKAEALVRDKCDVTAFMVWFIEHYPESAGTVRDHPEFTGCIWRERPAYSGTGYQSER